MVKPWIMLVIVLAVAMLALVRLRERTPARKLPFQRVASLLTPAEKQFVQVLDQVAGGRYRVLSKVRFADLFTIQASGKDWWQAFGRISNKHIDFVLADPTSWAPLLAIELDDSSHSRPQRRQRDELVDQICRAGGLPLLRIPVRKRLSPEEVGAEIARQISSSEGLPTPADPHAVTAAQAETAASSDAPTAGRRR
ncbi:Protein of unknown function (DUF2726) [Thermaerobacter subterraneus DSM 13965]|uniref:DUF2726 domain-containing protein n=1 Tax=Thermaerobacter subterraneus DSM 13965 TaxID=867903 RepID=K6QEI4_9FIRM|nr:Protein of unknown function (DUF2726) [Thermaerobacter subterraneus DSM 13965]